MSKKPAAAASYGKSKRQPSRLAISTCECGRIGYTRDGFLSPVDNRCADCHGRDAQASQHDQRDLVAALSGWRSTIAGLVVLAVQVVLDFRHGDIKPDSIPLYAAAVGLILAADNPRGKTH